MRGPDGPGVEALPRLSCSKEVEKKGIENYIIGRRTD